MFYPAAQRIASVTCLAGIFEKLARNSNRAW